MPPRRRRPQPRHLDAERLRLTRPSRVSVGALGGLLVGAVLAASLLAGDGMGRLASSDAADRARSDVGASEQLEPAAPGGAEPSDGAEQQVIAPARRLYRVVEADLIERATKPKPGRLSLAERAERVRESASISDFGVAMLNILGSNHTRGGKGGYAPGTNRAYSATQMLLARGVSIIGFSEIQGDQLGVFVNNAPAFDVYPGTSLGSAGLPTSVAWDTRVWRFVEAHTVTIPFSNQLRPAPVVKLANVASGREVWVFNVHNSPGGMEGERERAEAIELAKVRELEATGVPIIVTGDFNEREEALCKFTATTLQSAVGGGYCYPPPQPMRVDWIFASEAFSVNSWEVTRAAPVPYITDHAALFARLSLP